ncbi:MAG TPA: saccharopine dehydrogenase NADP-binding domain-containing protein, partial [Gemmataceae bacterium]|nr:saccharopine dehydrogenase NADP-binding domain-containing protein [Gemmataceae bacterium]
MDNYLIYGASGYTGALIAREALGRGHKPILAGRNAGNVAKLARDLGLDHRVFSLASASAIDEGIKGVRAVLHCAGPFFHTSQPMVAACLRNTIHYLDITGEIQVFEACAARDQEAKRAGIMLMPGVGFDVVPSDCLAAHLKRRLPSATALALGFFSKGGLSRGTATTMTENIHRGGAVRKGGVLTPVPAAWKTRTIDFGAGPMPAMTIPWGDVSTAYHSTRIPNIEVYIATKKKRLFFAKLSR